MLECMLAVSDRAKFGQDKYVSLSVPLLRAVYNFTTHQIDDGTCGVNRVRVIGTQLWLYGGYSNGGAGGYNDGGVIGPRLIGSCYMAWLHPARKNTERWRHWAEQ